MLFFTRAFLCIGAIVALAEGVNLAGLLEPGRPIAERATRQGMSAVTRFCKTDTARCVAIATAAAEAARVAAPAEPTASGLRNGVGEGARPSLRARAAAGRN